MKTLIYLTTRALDGTGGGREFMVRQTIEALLQEHAVIIVSLANSVSGLENRGSLGNIEYYSIGRPPLWEVTFNLFVSLFRDGQKTFQECLYFGRSQLKQLREIASKSEAVAIVGDMARVYSYLESFANIVKVSDLDDLLSSRYEQLSRMKHGGSLLGTAKLGKHYQILEFVLTPLRRRILAAEGRRMKRREANIAMDAALVLMVSPTEAKVLGALVPAASILPFPPSVPRLEYAAPAIGDTPDPFVALFLGDTRTAANRLALEKYVNEIVPAHSLHRGRVKFVVAGVIDDERLIVKMNEVGVEYLGFVGDLPKLLSSAGCLVAPFVTGTGIKIKIIESMAHGLPVITNSIGTQGLALENGRNYLHAETVDEFVHAIDQLAKNVKLCDDIGRGARLYIMRNHDRGKLVRALLDRIATALDSQGDMGVAHVS